MKTLEEKKAIALALIAPYYKDPSTCGFDGICRYETEDGKMCVAGKCMLPDFRPRARGHIAQIIAAHSDQMNVFLPEYVGVFTTEEWTFLQGIHDSFAHKSSPIEPIERLGLFTLPELEEYCKTLTA